MARVTRTAQIRLERDSMAADLKRWALQLPDGATLRTAVLPPDIAYDTDTVSITASWLGEEAAPLGEVSAEALAAVAQTGWHRP
jgi:hypothetical protein